MTSGRAIKKRALVKMGGALLVRALARDVAQAIADRMIRRARLVPQPDGTGRYTFN